MDWSMMVGIPFKDKGRTLHGCDCYGLVVLTYRLGRGIKLPLFLEGYEGRKDAEGVNSLIEEGKKFWAPVEKGKEQEFDVVLMSIRGFQHIGVVTKKGYMLHAPRDSYTAIERYDLPRFNSVVTGFYRYAGTNLH